MKSRLSKVLGKMPKENIELAKVELGLVDNFIKSAKVVSEMYGNAYNEKGNIKTIIKKILRGLEMANSAAQRSLKIGIDLEKQVKNLGVELPSDYNAYKGRLISDIEDIDKAIRIYKQIGSQVDF
tara:strand:+ start:135 stop:509 length:375 start_codon:yes stop_codon:yes gene_type:complete